MPQPKSRRSPHAAPFYLVDTAAPFISGQTMPLGFFVRPSAVLNQPVVSFEVHVHHADDPVENMRSLVKALGAKLRGEQWREGTQASWFLQPAASVHLSERTMSGFLRSGFWLRILPAVPRTLEPTQLAALATYEPMWTKDFFRRAPLPAELHQRKAGFGFAENDELFVVILSDADVTVFDRSSVSAIVVQKIVDGKGGPGGGMSGAAFLMVRADGRRGATLLQGGGDDLDPVGERLASRLGVPFRVTTSPDM